MRGLKLPVWHRLAKFWTRPQTPSSFFFTAGNRRGTFQGSGDGRSIILNKYPCGITFFFLLIFFFWGEVGALYLSYISNILDYASLSYGQIIIKLRTLVPYGNE